MLVRPYCAMILANMGAEVYKLEKLVTGDDSRAYGPHIGEMFKRTIIDSISLYSLTVGFTRRKMFCAKLLTVSMLLKKCLHVNFYMMKITSHVGQKMLLIIQLKLSFYLGLIKE